MTPHAELCSASGWDALRSTDMFRIIDDFLESRIDGCHNIHPSDR